MLQTKDHLRTIENAVSGSSEHEGPEWLVNSWARCLKDYKLDPSRQELIDLSAKELRTEKDLFEGVQFATEELEWAHRMISGSGYSAFIANRNGVIIDQRLSRDAGHYCITNRIGALWSEEVGGTNGIGTTLRNEGPTSVYLRDHFFAELTEAACASAPFFDPRGQVLGVVNLCTQNPAVAFQAHRIIFDIARAAASRIESACFRHQFRRCRILTFRADKDSPVIIAVGPDFEILGATRGARALFGMDDAAIGKRSLWGVFERTRTGLTIANFDASVRQLTPIGRTAPLDVSLECPVSPLQAPTASQPVQNSKSKEAGQGFSIAECAGTDPTMRRNADILRRVFGTGLHILILGETGVGKDTLSSALHKESARASRPFVAFNCSAVPETLIDSELFGYKGGAFTGANKNGSQGRIVEADKGTLFLDEIGDMPLPLQVRLLRFLESREVTPLGSGKTRSVDVQVIAATHNDLEQKVLDGAFRQDLFYRLAGAVVTVPPLRERVDFRRIVDLLLTNLSPQTPLQLTNRAWGALEKHSWPGNIRELKNVLFRAARLASGHVIDVDDLMIIQQRSHVETMVRQIAKPSTNWELANHPSIQRAKEAAETAESEAIEAAISRCNGNEEFCAVELGISRATLYRKLRRHGLSLKTSKKPRSI